MFDRQDPRVSSVRLFFAAALIAFFASPSLAASQILPHRAIYDLKLSKTQANSTVTQAQGFFEFEWEDACSGWTVLHQTRLKVDYSDGRQLDFGASHKSWESKDGKKYQFFIKRNYNGATVEEVRGEAERGEGGARGTARYSAPDDREMTLPKGAVFPTQHSLELLNAAEGETLPLWRIVFDGSGDDGFFGISAALVRRLAPGEDLGEVAAEMSDEASWRMQLAFFDVKNQTGAPEQEQGLRIFANGVVDELELDYGDFVVKARLRELKPFAAPDC
ncbi:DUF1849 family protein [Pelagibius sp. Alg239-R121]|uniref:EipB family protein n=1 Tax=Pelagibius sp. Alg239-R121 TaxID=2993448 RepID=UPI0024A6BB10|nr:DUF1849 family protein [Pelagibius sp. Alg239-R121]